jgi:MtN3 and saliva related transmembrane protein
MDYTQAIGFLAAILTTAANFPQAYKIIKTKSTKDISVVTYSLLTAGGILWIIYGISQKDIPLVLANGISASLCVVILILKSISSKQIGKIKDAITK